MFYVSVAVALPQFCQEWGLDLLFHKYTILCFISCFCKLLVIFDLTALGEDLKFAVKVLLSLSEVALLWDKK